MTDTVDVIALIPIVEVEAYRELNDRIKATYPSGSRPRPEEGDV